MRYLKILLLLILLPNICFALKEFNSGVSNISVDKTPFLKAIIEEKNKIILITRPHSWGGTYNLIQVENFFMPVIDKQCCENTILKEIKRQKIDNTLIGIEKEVVDQYHGNYPTILLSFSFNKVSGIKFFKDSLIYRIQKLFQKHSYLLESSKISYNDKQKYNKYIERYPNLSDEDVKKSVRFLSDLLHKHFDMPVIILFNKYDDFLKAYSMDFINSNTSLAPSEFTKEATRNIGDIIFTALNQNPNLLRGVIFGTTKIKEMSFLKIKNITEDSILTPYWGDYFGFTNNELNLLFDEYGVKNVTDDLRKKIKKYYGGYSLKGQEIYNPAGIMRMLKKYKAQQNIDFTHIRYIAFALNLSDKKRKALFERLVNGQSEKVVIDPQISYLNMYDSLDNLCSILVYEGFLSASSLEKLSNGKFNAIVKIPNEEIRERFRFLLQKSKVN